MHFGKVPSEYTKFLEWVLTFLFWHYGLGNQWEAAGYQK
jgi:hypothetical protein